MRYLTPCAIIFCMTVNAETGSNNSDPSTTLVNSTSNIQQTTQFVASKLITILGLTTVSRSEQNSISLKSVVIKALSEGKQMSEIRLATNQAVKEVTGRKLSASNHSRTQSVSTVNDVQPKQSFPAANIANPAEVSLDPENGKLVATVLPGESIFRLAQRVYGKEHGRKYLEIYAANRDKIKDINVVVEGQVLTMP